MAAVKCVLVGNARVGKTCLVSSYEHKQFPEDYIPRVASGYTCDIQFNNSTVKLSIHDTAGSDEYSKLRPLEYANANVFVICFAVNDRDSFDAVVSAWLVEVKGHSPSTPILLCGTQTDQENRAVFKEEALELCKQLHLKGYVECSARTLSGLDDLFTSAVDAALTHRIQDQDAVTQDVEVRKPQEMHAARVENHLSALYNQQKYSDIELILPVSHKSIYANSFVLAAHSKFFDQLLFGEQQEPSVTMIPQQEQEPKITTAIPQQQQPNVTVIPNNRPTVYIADAVPEHLFDIMIRFIYTEEIIVNEDNVTALRDIAKYYGVLSLAEQCEEYFAQILTLDNVFNFLNNAETQGMHKLMQYCIAFVCKHARNVFVQNLHFQFGKQTFITLLQRDDLNAKEVDIFKGMMRWCQHHHQDDAQAAHELAKQLSPYIRYSTISFKELMNEVFTADLIPLSQRLDILENLTLKGKENERKAAMNVDFSIRKKESFKGLLNAGWKIVYQKPYSHGTTNDELKKIRQLFAENPDTLVCCIGKNVNDDLCALAAFGPLKDALNNTMSKTEARKFGNVYWYNVLSESFGFAEAANISLGSADTVAGELRLSWHLSGSGGYRLGDSTNMNATEEWEKILLALE